MIKVPTYFKRLKEIPIVTTSNSDGNNDKHIEKGLRGVF